MDLPALMKAQQAATPTFAYFRRRAMTELRPYVEGEDMTGISVSNVDAANLHPKAGDWIARNPKDYSDQWLVTGTYFAVNYEPIDEAVIS